VSERVREISGNSEFYPDTLGFGENSRHWTEYAVVWGLSPPAGSRTQPLVRGPGGFFYFLRGIEEIQHLDFMCNNKFKFMKNHAGDRRHILDHTTYKYYW